MADEGLAADQKKARRQRATVIFADESGFSLVPTRVRTWAPIGRTPIVRHPASWPKLSAISGVSSKGRLYMLFRRGSITVARVLVFLRHLLRHVRGRIIVIWDNLSTHKAAAVRAFVHEHRHRLTLEYFPPYSPDLNPDEGVWRHLKRVELPNLNARNIEELKHHLRLAVMRTRARPELVRSFIHASELPFR